jgi:hypothetical protein
MGTAFGAAVAVGDGVVEETGKDEEVDTNTVQSLSSENV